MSFRIFLWKRLTRLYQWFLRKHYGMEIGDDVRVSWKAHLDKSVNPKGIHIGSGTRILNGAMVLAHDDLDETVLLGCAQSLCLEF